MAYKPYRSIQVRPSGRDCRNPEYMEVFELAIHGTGSLLPCFPAGMTVFVNNDLPMTPFTSWLCFALQTRVNHERWSYAQDISIYVGVIIAK